MLQYTRPRSRREGETHHNLRSATKPSRHVTNVPKHGVTALDTKTSLILSSATRTSPPNAEHTSSALRSAVAAPGILAGRLQHSLAQFLHLHLRPLLHTRRQFSNQPPSHLPPPTVVTMIPWQQGASRPFPPSPVAVNNDDNSRSRSSSSAITITKPPLPCHRPQSTCPSNPSLHVTSSPTLCFSPVRTAPAAFSTIFSRFWSRQTQTVIAWRICATLSTPVLWHLGATGFHPLPAFLPPMDPRHFPGDRKGPSSRGDGKKRRC